MNLVDTLPDSVKDLITEYNAIDKLNRLMYYNPEVKQLVHDKLIEGNYSKQSYLEYRKFQIERELIPIIHELYHGKEVLVPNRSGMLLKGVIIHEKTREYNGQTLDNGVSFRNIIAGDLESGETIALWVDTGDKFDSHLYTSDKIVFPGK